MKMPDGDETTGQQERADQDGGRQPSPAMGAVGCGCGGCKLGRRVRGDGIRKRFGLRGLGFGGNGMALEREGVASPGDVDEERFTRACGVVILRQLGAQAADLDADTCVVPGIEIGATAQDFSGDPVLFEAIVRRVEGVVRKVFEQPAERFRVLQMVALDDAVDLGEGCVAIGIAIVRAGGMRFGETVPPPIRNEGEVARDLGDVGTQSSLR